MKTKIGIIALLSFCCSTVLFAQYKDPTEDQKKLDFLVGNWKTVSTFPATGAQGTGDLSYRWVLGGAWLKVEYYGKRPDNRLWEAHGMIKYDPGKGHYISIVFFDSEGPYTFNGHWLDEKTIRFEIEMNGTKSGIDYTRKDDGTVYQENWRLSPEGERQVTLKTNYTPAQ